MHGKQPEHGPGVVSYVHTELAVRPGADAAVAALYRSHAGTTVRLAIVIIRDPAMAEDVVQEAFCGLYRQWPRLSGPDKALPYVRMPVLNGCRTVLRHRARRAGTPLAEATALRFLAGLDDAEIAEAMGISRGTVKSTISRGLAALGKHLGAGPMNEVEGRLRALTRALEDTFPDRGVAPLSLPPAGSRAHGRRRPWFHRRPARGWIVPLAAAAAVIAIVAASTVLTRGVGAAPRHRPPPTPTVGLAAEIPPSYSSSELAGNGWNRARPRTSTCCDSSRATIPLS